MQLPFHAHYARVRPHGCSTYTLHRQSCVQTLALTPIVITPRSAIYVQYNAVMCNDPVNSSVRKDLRQRFRTNLAKFFPSAASA